MLLRMITVGGSHNGVTYHSHQLRKNDCWAAGEKEVRGECIEDRVKTPNPDGSVMNKPFNTLRQNRHPIIGELLTARDRLNRVASFGVRLPYYQEQEALGHFRFETCDEAEIWRVVDDGYSSDVLPTILDL